MDLLQGEHPEVLAQSDPPPVDMSVGDIRSQIEGEWLQRNGHNEEPIGNHIALSNGAISDPLGPPLPPNGVP